MEERGTTKLFEHFYFLSILIVHLLYEFKLGKFVLSVCCKFGQRLGAVHPKHWSKYKTYVDLSDRSKLRGIIVKYLLFNKLEINSNQNI